MWESRFSSSSGLNTRFDACLSNLMMALYSTTVKLMGPLASMRTALRIRQAKKKPAPDFTSGTGYWCVTNGREKLARRVVLAWLNSGSYELARVSIAYMFDDGIACTANR